MAWASDSAVTPVLQWVTALGGSGTSQVTGAAVDRQGNLYITGSTNSLDFPTTPSAAQRSAGGSTLIRVNAASGTSQNLYPNLAGSLAFAADPRNSLSVYIASAGGLSHSSDGGATWSAVQPLPTVGMVYSVAVDPTDSRVLYAGTAPLGAIKSTDGGLTWTAINNGIPAAVTPNDSSISVNGFYIDPRSPHTLYAFSQSGMVRSTDGGASWTLAIADVWYYGTLAFDPLTPGTLYVSGESIAYKSTDGGQTFVRWGNLPDFSYPNIVVPDPQHQGVLTAASAAAIFRSVDAGITWTRQLLTGGPALIAGDPNGAAIYAGVLNMGILRSTDGFATYSQFGPPVFSVSQMLVAGASVYVADGISTDVFVTKLDPHRNILYSTYFGGTGNDNPVGLALGPDGSIYVAGNTTSADFPFTPGAYSNGSGGSGSFVFKLNPDGSLAWSTALADYRSPILALAVDSSGNVYLGGSSFGGLPTTPGAYQTQIQTSPCSGVFVPCFPGQPAAFLSTLDPSGAKLIFSTYVQKDTQNNPLPGVQAVALAPDGSIWAGGTYFLFKVNAAGSAVSASTYQPSITINSLAVDASANVYAAGLAVTDANRTFPATAGAFQTAPRPGVLSVPITNNNSQDGFVMKWDSSLSQILAATLIGGDAPSAVQSLALDASGNVIVSGSSNAKGFPTLAPFQTSFSGHSGVIAELDANLSHLLFSTYLGDTRPFDAHVTIPDGNGNLLMAGSTIIASGPSGVVYVNQIALAPAPSARLDSVVNFASRLASPICPGEAIAAVGSGFGADAQLMVDGTPLPLVSQSPTQLVAVLPFTAKASGAYQVTVLTGGASSNSVLAPAGPASPGIFSVDGSGVGQGYILNADGTPNSPSNPAASGSAITIFATGVGPYTMNGSFPVTALSPAVFVNNVYADGIGSALQPVAGLPGLVYRISVYVPDPAAAKANIQLLPQSPVRLVMGPVNPGNPSASPIVSQIGLALSVKQ